MESSIPVVEQDQATLNGQIRGVPRTAKVNFSKYFVTVSSNQRARSAADADAIGRRLVAGWRRFARQLASDVVVALPGNPSPSNALLQVTYTPAQVEIGPNRKHGMRVHFHAMLTYAHQTRLRLDGPRFQEAMRGALDIPNAVIPGIWARARLIPAHEAIARYMFKQATGRRIETSAALGRLDAQARRQIGNEAPRTGAQEVAAGKDNEELEEAAEALAGLRIG